MIPWCQNVNNSWFFQETDWLHSVLFDDLSSCFFLSQYPPRPRFAGRTLLRSSFNCRCGLNWKTCSTRTGWIWCCGRTNIPTKGCGRCTTTRFVSVGKKSDNSQTTCVPPQEISFIITPNAYTASTMCGHSQDTFGPFQQRQLAREALLGPEETGFSLHSMKCVEPGWHDSLRSFAGV